MGGVSNKAIYEPEVFERLGRLDVILALDNDKAGRECSDAFAKVYTDTFKRKLTIFEWDKIGNTDDPAEALEKGFLTPIPNYHSQIVNETFITTDEGGVLFSGGAYYAPSELEQFKTMNREQKTQIHTLKHKFEGALKCQ